MLADWRGDEEDSLGIEDRRRRARPDAPLQIAVVRLPFISNYTDFDALADEPDVNVRYVDDAGRAGRRGRGRAAGHQEHDRRSRAGCARAAWRRRCWPRAAAGTPVIGVCGGYQMLGRRIHDPEHVESRAGSVDGLGLLDAETTFTGDKRTVRVEGELLASPSGSCASAGPLGAAGTPLHGYEIHMGRTTLGSDAAPLLRLRGADGSAHDDGAVAAGSATPAGPVVCGSYVHGLFDHAALRGAFLDGLRAARGLPLRGAAAAPPDDDIDRLADHVEAHLDADLLAHIVGLEAR